MPLPEVARERLISHFRGLQVMLVICWCGYRDWTVYKVNVTHNLGTISRE